MLKSQDEDEHEDDDEKEKKCVFIRVHPWLK
jgi:hypothetical protein